MRRTASARVLCLAAVAAASLVARPSSAALADLPVPLTFNNDCFAPAAQFVVDGNCDGGGNVFLDDSSVPPAGPLKLKGVTFAFPARGSGTSNTMVATGQTVTLPGRAGYSYLQLLSFGTNGKISPATATVKYGDGSSQVVTVTVDDWATAAGAALDMHEQGPFNPGNARGGSNHAFIVSVPLKKKAAAASITLPVTTVPGFTNSGAKAIQYLAMTLSAHPVTTSAPVFH